MAKPKKKRIRLKSSFKRFLIYLALFIIVIIYATNEITKIKADFAYKKTNEYKLLQIGYPEYEVNLIINNLSDNQITNILKQKYQEDYIKFINQKYFLSKNFEKYISYKESNKKEQDYSKIIALVNVHADSGWYNEIYETDTSKEYSMLVNKSHYLNKDYQNENIINVNLAYSYANNKADTIVIENFEKMRNDVQNELNVKLMINSSYRSYQDQEDTYEYQKEIDLETADQYAARPGFSEHQTGLAIDITSLEHKGKVSFTASTEYAWLKDNCYKYGFILRYPEGKEDITGYSNESWHFRYVGYDIAKTIHDEDITFDEYYAYYIEK